MTPTVPAVPPAPLAGPRCRPDGARLWTCLAGGLGLLALVLLFPTPSHAGAYQVSNITTGCSVTATASPWVYFESTLSSGSGFGINVRYCTGSTCNAASGTLIYSGSGIVTICHGGNCSPAGGVNLGPFPLTPSTVYQYSVTPINSSDTVTPSSFQQTTSACVPPPSVTTNPATSITGSGATLNGSANPQGAAATGWFRYRTTSPGSCNDSFGTRVPASGGTALGSGSSAVSYSQAVSGLTAGQTYYYCALASNAGGTGFGALVSFLAASPPSAPQNVTAAVSGDRQVTVTWTAPATNGGSAITSYSVKASPGGQSVTVNGTTLTATVTGLTAGTSYTFTVTATNAAGTGPGATSAAVTAITVPGAPQNVTVSDTGSRQATLTWTAPASNGGSPIIRYLVSDSTGQHSVFTLGTETTATVTGLTNGTTYRFTVTAINLAGLSPASASSNGVTPSGTPGTPTAATATPGDGQVTVTWTAPASDGGSPITSYTIVASDGKTVTVNGTTTTATLTGLTNGLTYTFAVFATNAKGSSVIAAFTPPVPVGPPPGAPVYVLAVAGPGPGEATVTWYPYPAGISLVLSYTVTAAPGGQAVMVGGRVTTAIVPSLLAGTVSTFTVRALTSSGLAPASLPSNPIVIP